MFEQRFVSALVIALGTIALTVATVTIIVGPAEPSSADVAPCGLEAIPDQGVSVLTCEDPFDVERSRVWAIWTHCRRCDTQPGALPGPWKLVCESGVTVSLDGAGSSWTRCNAETGADARLDVSSECRLVR